MQPKDIEEFEKKIGISFDNKNILKQAFVHRSYLNENKGFSLGHNERLEFLGDAVLELVVTDYLFSKYKDKNEGEMTSLRASVVNAVTLSEIGSSLGIGEYLHLSKGESKDVGRARQYILANTMEALIGALYVDKGYDTARDFIYSTICPTLEAIVSNGSWVDAKSLFQEKAQEYEGATPQYKTIKETGPDHDKHFTVGVYVRNELFGQGQGNSKQNAEQMAAQNALKERGWTE
jgi:ribonuclease III